MTKQRSYYTQGEPQLNFYRSGNAWQQLPLLLRADFNDLCLKMQQAGLFPSGPRQSGYTLFVQMNRAATSVYASTNWTSVPSVPWLPPALPQFTVTANATTVHLNGPAYAGGCQVWLSKPFVPGIRDPYSQRTFQTGRLPDGWPDGGIDLSAMLPAGVVLETGAAFVVKLVPVSREGFVGPSLACVCVVGAE